MDLYRSGDEDLHNPYFAPLQAADFRDQPDTLIITAEYCPLRDEAEEYGHRLMKAGNRVMICDCGNGNAGLMRHADGLFR